MQRSVLFDTTAVPPYDHAANTPSQFAHRHCALLVHLPALKVHETREHPICELTTAPAAMDFGY